MSAPAAAAGAADRAMAALDPPDEAGTALSGGARIAWRAYGAGDPVLMIMGFMGSGRAWFRLLPHVAARHRAIVLDNRGTGDSDRPLGLYTMDALAADALAVLDDAGVEGAHVVGASMGGMIAQHVALAAPERVRSLSLLCTHPGGRRGGPPPWRMIAALGLRPLLGPARSLPLVAPMLYAEHTRADRGRMAVEQALRARDATPLATAPAQVAAIARHDTRRRLGDLRMPVLIVHGAVDRLIPVSAAHEMAAEIAHARLVILPRAGHVLTTDDEQGTAAAVTGFLAEAGAGG